MRSLLRFSTTLAVLFLAAALLGGEDKPPPGGIAWHGTWMGGLAEAKRTQRPILLLAAAPQCHGVSGIW